MQKPADDHQDIAAKPNYLSKDERLLAVHDGIQEPYNTEENEQDPGKNSEAGCRPRPCLDNLWYDRNITHYTDDISHIIYNDHFSFAVFFLFFVVRHNHIVT